MKSPCVTEIIFPSPFRPRHAYKAIYQGIPFWVEETTQQRSTVDRLATIHHICGGNLILAWTMFQNLLSIVYCGWPDSWRYAPVVLVHTACYWVLITDMCQLHFVQLQLNYNYIVFEQLQLQLHWPISEHQHDARWKTLSFLKKFG